MSESKMKPRLRAEELTGMIYNTIQYNLFSQHLSNNDDSEAEIEAANVSYMPD